MSFPYHTEVPRVLVFGLIGFTCAIMAPLILPFMLVHFFLAYLVYRNQVIFHFLWFLFSFVCMAWLIELIRFSHLLFFHFHLIDSQCIHTKIWRWRTLLAYFSQYNNLFIGVVTNYSNWSVWNERITNCIKLHVSTSYLHYFIQRVLQAPILPYFPKGCCGGSHGNWKFLFFFLTFCLFLYVF